MKDSYTRTLRVATLLTIAVSASACSSTAENPLAPERTTLTPGAASFSTSALPPGGVLPPGHGEIERLGLLLGWP